MPKKRTYLSHASINSLSALMTAPVMSAEAHRKQLHQRRITRRKIEDMKDSSRLDHELW